MSEPSVERHSAGDGKVIPGDKLVVIAHLGGNRYLLQVLRTGELIIRKREDVTDADMDAVNRMYGDVDPSLNAH